MQNLFVVIICEKISQLSIKAKEYMMECSCDKCLKIMFKAVSLPECWIYMKDEHLELSQLAAKVLLLFGMTYLCENHFQQ
jgi:hypothetical protein